MERGLQLFAKPDKFRLREPQLAMVAAFEKDMTDAGDVGLIIAPTGIGKTELAAELIKRHRTALFISPFIDTTKQSAERFRSRGMNVGLEWQTSKSDDLWTVGCYDSLISKDRYQRYVGFTDLVIVDEVHLNYSKASLQMLTHFQEAGSKILGLTATPERSGDPITDFYKKIIYEYRIPQATQDGWLVPAKIWLMVEESLDLSDFIAVYGELRPPKAGDPLHRILAKEQTVQAIASMIFQHYEGKSSIVFAAGIRQAERLVEALRDRGVAASIVHSRMDKLERAQHLADFESGVTKIIINVGCLIVGYDFPPMEKLFLARPTVSRSRFTQMVGRMTRPLKGVVDGWATAEERRNAIAASAKPFFEVFDITDSSRRCDLLSTIDLMLDGVDPAVVARVKRKVEGKCVTRDEIDMVAKEEAEQLARETAIKTDIEIRRNGAVIGAQFGAYGRDQWAKAEEHSKPKYRGWHILWGKWKGWPLPDAVAEDAGWVRWHLTKLRPEQETYAAAVRRELRKQGRIP